MAFPTIASYLTGNRSSNGTTSSIIAPSGTVAGDLIVLIITKDGTGTFTTPADWTMLANTAYSAQCVGIFYRTLDATLSDFTIAHASEMTSWIILRIPNGDIPQISTIANGSSTVPNPASLTHSFGVGTEVLWIACAGWDYNRSCSSYPTTFPDNRYNSRCTSTSGSGTAMATLSSTTNPQDPGTFTISAKDTWSAYTIAIKERVIYTITGDGTLTGSSTLEASGNTIKISPQINITGSGTLVSSGNTIKISPQINITGSNNFTTSGITIRKSDGTLVGSGNIVASGITIRKSSANITGSSTVITSGTVIKISPQINIAGSSNFTASGTVIKNSPQINITGTSTLEASGTVIKINYQVVIATVDEYLKFRVLDELIENSIFSLNENGIVEVNEIIESNVFNLSPTGVLTVVELIEGAI